MNRLRQAPPLRVSPCVKHLSDPTALGYLSPI